MNLRRFQPSNGKCNIRTFFVLPYKEIRWLNLYLCSPGTLYMYSRAGEKDHFTIIESIHFNKRITFALHVL